MLVFHVKTKIKAKKKNSHLYHSCSTSIHPRSECSLFIRYWSSTSWWSDIMSSSQKTQTNRHQMVIHLFIHMYFCCCCFVICEKKHRSYLTMKLKVIIPQFMIWFQVTSRKCWIFNVKNKKKRRKKRNKNSHCSLLQHLYSPSFWMFTFHLLLLHEFSFLVIWYNAPLSKNNNETKHTKKQ